MSETVGAQFKYVRFLFSQLLFAFRFIACAPQAAAGAVAECDQSDNAALRALFETQPT
jgi:hypothetical protein